MGPSDSIFGTEFTSDLRTYLSLCQEVMSLTSRENQALTSPEGYAPFEFYQTRKDLLPRLDQSLMCLRKWRQRWQQTSPAGRSGCSELKPLFQAVQGLLMKVLLLDRENQQALLRRGLVPARQLPSPALQQPHCVADLYRRHARR